MCANMKICKTLIFLFTILNVTKFGSVLSLYRKPSPKTCFLHFQAVCIDNYHYQNCKFGVPIGTIHRCSKHYICIDFTKEVCHEAQLLALTKREIPNYFELSNGNMDACKNYKVCNEYKYGLSEHDHSDKYKTVSHCKYYSECNYDKKTPKINLLFISKDPFFNSLSDQKKDDESDNKTTDLTPVFLIGLDENDASRKKTVGYEPVGFIEDGDRFYKPNGNKYQRRRYTGEGDRFHKGGYRKSKINRFYDNDKEGYHRKLRLTGEGNHFYDPYYGGYQQMRHFPFGDNVYDVNSDEWYESEEGGYIPNQILFSGEEDEEEDSSFDSDEQTGLPIVNFLYDRAGYRPVGLNEVPRRFIDEYQKIESKAAKRRYLEGRLQTGLKDELRRFLDEYQKIEVNTEGYSKGHRQRKLKGETRRILDKRIEANTDGKDHLKDQRQKPKEDARRILDEHKKTERNTEGKQKGLDRFLSVHQKTESNTDGTRQGVSKVKGLDQNMKSNKQKNQNVSRYLSNINQDREQPMRFVRVEAVYFNLYNKGKDKIKGIEPVKLMEEEIPFLNDTDGYQTGINEKVKNNNERFKQQEGQSKKISQKVNGKLEPNRKEKINNNGNDQRRNISEKVMVSIRMKHPQKKIKTQESLHKRMESNVNGNRRLYNQRKYQMDVNREKTHSRKNHRQLNRKCCPDANDKEGNKRTEKISHLLDGHHKMGLNGGGRHFLDDNFGINDRVLDVYKEVFNMGKGLIFKRHNKENPIESNEKRNQVPETKASESNEQNEDRLSTNDDPNLKRIELKIFANAMGSQSISFDKMEEGRPYTFVKVIEPRKTTVHVENKKDKNVANDEGRRALVMNDEDISAKNDKLKETKKERRSKKTHRKNVSASGEEKCASEQVGSQEGNQKKLKKNRTKFQNGEGSFTNCEKPRNNTTNTNRSSKLHKNQNYREINVNEMRKHFIHLKNNNRDQTIGLLLKLHIDNGYINDSQPVSAKTKQNDNHRFYSSLKLGSDSDEESVSETNKKQKTKPNEDAYANKKILDLKEKFKFEESKNNFETTGLKGDTRYPNIFIKEDIEGRRLNGKINWEDFRNRNNTYKLTQNLPSLRSIADLIDLKWRPKSTTESEKESNESIKTYEPINLDMEQDETLSIIIKVNSTNLNIKIPKKQNNTNITNHPFDLRLNKNCDQECCNKTKLPKCVSPGYFSIKYTNCNKYVQCVERNLKWIVNIFQCSEGYSFNPITSKCTMDYECQEFNICVNNFVFSIDQAKLGNRDVVLNMGRKVAKGENEKDASNQKPESTHKKKSNRRNKMNKRLKQGYRRKFMKKHPTDRDNFDRNDDIVDLEIANSFEKYEERGNADFSMNDMTEFSENDENFDIINDPTSKEKHKKRSIDAKVMRKIKSKHQVKQKLARRNGKTESTKIGNSFEEDKKEDDNYEENNAEEETSDDKIVLKYKKTQNEPGKYKTEQFWPKTNELTKFSPDHKLLDASIEAYDNLEELSTALKKYIEISKNRTGLNNNLYVQCGSNIKIPLPNCNCNQSEKFPIQDVGCKYYLFCNNKHHKCTKQILKCKNGYFNPLKLSCDNNYYCESKNKCLDDIKSIVHVKPENEIELPRKQKIFYCRQTGLIIHLPACYEQIKYIVPKTGCRNYINCSQTLDRAKIIVGECPKNTYFDNVTKTCQYGTDCKEINDDICHQKKTILKCKNNTYIKLPKCILTPNMDFNQAWKIPVNGTGCREFISCNPKNEILPSNWKKNEELSFYGYLRKCPKNWKFNEETQLCQFNFVCYSSDLCGS